ncbi:contactin-2-like [Liolophura sinensis]|uniref:contactin-2-like n=1 Tax=Liolophura sinensis TaxID=3198878 RepID=UPI0031591A13
MNVQCNVSNSIGYQLADAFLNVIDQTKLDVRPQPKYVVDPGKVLEVPIMAVADPLYHRLLTYRWSKVKGGQAVSKNPADPVYVDVSNTLIINATGFDRDQAFLEILGNYSCLVSMGLEKGEGDVVVYTHISSDEEEAKAEPPKINSGFLKKIFFWDVTDSKTLDCTADGIPAVEYEWHRNGVKIVEQPGSVEVSGGRLQLLRPTLNDEGFYQCFASNAHGKSMSTVVEIQKAQLLDYKTLPVANIGTHDVGSHVTLTCRDQPMSVPTAVYDWFIGKSEAIITGGRIVIDQVGDLHFINVEMGDELAGEKTYNCSLYNVVAQLRVSGSPTKFKVNPGMVSAQNRMRA